ncbi:MAG: tRNA (adenosine(37)-N6)-threonylcarbamoyltransferase complex transferase subunit TsaD [Cytophagales bacterium]|jgi:N6-L-threonylcarbamoyladenine synthase|nr:tRNA (adenosine(37)-N6)-threonylcarbamoyltransferase complex transferase subunit TsaD [Cytophagales bacterium]MCA6387105.1 tRNA (adenosine(37)-N6)-threonylcarbamoyltransferase complex transferase subunit TsaD [Cytophagales bacterium]MCA6389777.1 tRNA (adenosine(37)-N6)-threonylcarbamoyltransferase complex transferase subunit TsaD [Cytophagales bacterium]MCA6397055.1 tRNA (adenosine(37)-N6)-threonylcarbamoyltransferase complex transferase subunit TsaD [Cytophagales bacterium]MCA6399054.1 tRNA
MYPTILAIESSCDETSASVIQQGKVVNNIIASQNVHQKYGGVVPELASRAHQQNILYVVNEAIITSGIQKSDLHAIAFTRGPGLLGSLLVGVSFAKGMALALDIPLIDVNHMEAHVLAHFIDPPAPIFPFLCLTVSGGHTQIVLVEDYLCMQVLGETQDDAVGEAFDKAAKMMGLPYPGGPLIDKYAQLGNPKAFAFADTNMPGLSFSFSGIKTSFLYFLRDKKREDPDFVEKNLNDICASLQFQLVKMLIQKVIAASRQTGIKQIAIAGGVAANSGLRNELKASAQKFGWTIYIPEFQYCTDNAAMIAMAAHFKFVKGIFSEMDVSPIANMAIENR